MPGALVSVWGSTASDVWLVGGDCADAATPQCPAGEETKGPMGLRYDGKAWTRLLTGHKGDLWWVHGFAGGPLFMGGGHGAILRYQGGKFEEMVTPKTAGTVFGIWGDKPDSLWAVGGSSNPSGGFIWRWDGKTWSPDSLAPKDLEATATVFKAWGTGPKDVWFVGTKGLILHYDGQAYVKVDPPLTDQPLFTVYGAEGRVYAVGGDGIILEYDGSAWKPPPGPKNGQQMNGVSARGSAAYAVGVFGGVLRRDATGWVKVSTGKEVQDDFHGVWIDPDGGVWCAGGRIAATPLIDGRLLYFGTADVPGATYQTTK